MIGAALTALELFTRSGDFQVLSRWLRSPFFVPSGGEAEARGMLETRLRSRISSQLIFREAFYEGGLEAKIRAELPALGEVLGEAAALMRSQPRQATPSHWAAVWRQLLSVLDWHGSAARASTTEDWESALNALALLTPILGLISASDTLLELQDILGRSRRHGTLPVYGVFVIHRSSRRDPGLRCAMGLRAYRHPVAACTATHPAAAVRLAERTWHAFGSSGRCPGAVPANHSTPGRRHW